MTFEEFEIVLWKNLSLWNYIMCELKFLMSCKKLDSYKKHNLIISNSFDLHSFFTINGFFDYCHLGRDFDRIRIILNQSYTISMTGKKLHSNITIDKLKSEII